MFNISTSETGAFNGAAISMVDVVVLGGSYPLLAGASLQVAEHEIVLLEGPNGAGKTSVLRACAGLLPIHRGSLHVVGIDVVNDRGAVAGNVGYLGHANGLYRELTAIENLTFFARALQSKDSARSENSVSNALDAVKISTRVAATRVDQLSAGQRRRTAVAALLLSSTSLWLLDEPHAGLDANSREIIDSTVRESHISVLFASHERERAHNLADRVVIMQGGSVVSGQMQASHA
jgi:heme ABC exporter ATP-binding subunit CcmA